MNAPSKPQRYRHIQPWLPGLPPKAKIVAISPGPVPATSRADELPRIFRYLPKGAIPDGNRLLAIFSPKQNLLIINKDLYDPLSEEDKRMVLRTQHTLTIG